MAAKKKKKLSPLEEVRRVALEYPGAEEHFPWGEAVLKVNGKVFAFLGRKDDDEPGISVKLPHTGGMALGLPFCEPTAYGLGKSGWVTATFKSRSAVPVKLLLQWVDESYRAVAPKKLVKLLDERA